MKKAGKTLVVEFHAWRGLHKDGGELGTVLILAWVSFTWVPFLLNEWLKTKIAELRAFTRK